MDLFTATSKLTVAYKPCAMKESKENIKIIEEQCPGVRLPEPNMFKLFQRHETAKWTYIWDGKGINATELGDVTKEVYGDLNNLEGGDGKSAEGFKCSTDCQNCYGKDKKYYFQDAEGWDINGDVPFTTVYNTDSEEKIPIPWINKDLWTPNDGTYSPRCECEPSYYNDNPQKPCPKSDRTDIDTMVCMLVRKQGGVLQGCHEGHFVLSLKKRGSKHPECWLVQIKLKNPDYDLEPVEGKNIKASFKCAKDFIGALSKSRIKTADRAYPTVYRLRNYCPRGFKGESKLSHGTVKYCKKNPDKADAAGSAQKFLSRSHRRRLLQNPGGS